MSDISIIWIFKLLSVTSPVGSKIWIISNNAFLPKTLLVYCFNWYVLILIIAPSVINWFTKFTPRKFSSSKYFDVNGDGAYNAVDIVRAKKIAVS